MGPGRNGRREREERKGEKGRREREGKGRKGKGEGQLVPQFLDVAAPLKTVILMLQNSETP